MNYPILVSLRRTLSLQSVILLLTLVPIVNFAQQRDFTIAFGSCSRQSDTLQMWREVASLQPDVWVWGGDNIYGDSHDVQVMRSKYDIQKNHPGYQALIRKTPVTGTWDDHDYGVNDGGKYFSKKDEFKKEFIRFMGFEKNKEITTHEGVYNTHSIRRRGKEVLIINLDTRSFRDTIYRAVEEDSLTGVKHTYYAKNMEGTILGEAQWAWLEQVVRTSAAKLFIINSSIQVISEQHRFEKWANFPKERERLFQLVSSFPDKRFMIISGDRHIAEISVERLAGVDYPLIDFTSSGLTHVTANAKEDNKHREGALISKKNFGIIGIRFTEKAIEVTLELRSYNGTVHQTRTYSL